MNTPAKKARAFSRPGRLRFLSGAAAAALAAGLLLTPSPAQSQEAGDYPFFAAIGQEAENVAQDLNHWTLNGGWEIAAEEDGIRLAADSSGESAFYEEAHLSGCWQVNMTVDFADAPNDREAVITIPLGVSAQSARISVVLTRHPSGLTSVSVDQLGNAGRVLHSGWISGGDTLFDVTIARRDPEKNALSLEIYGDNTFAYCETTPDLGNAQEEVKGFGIAAGGFPLTVSKVRAANREPKGTYAAMARAAVSDMVKNFWTGGPSNGHTLTTWGGYPSENLPDPHGMMWERALMVIPMYSLYRATLDPVLETRLKAEWAFIKEAFTPEELAAAGSSLHPAVDDSGWSAMGYLCLYQVTQDPAALDAARQMADNAVSRWQDDTMGGGLWYNDDRQFKSIYQCGILTTLFTLWEIDQTQEAEDKFFSVYNWVESSLRRDDGLYWANLYENGPDGQSRPYDIREGGSVTCLMANMAMGCLNARLYRLTGDESYKDKAVATAEGIYEHETKDGILLNDRDAWANGTFAAEWAVQVLTLPGIDEKHGELLKKTADSIYANARTGDGYYGGSWAGPADGIGSVWFTVGSRPQQLMTTGNSVNFLVAAALLEALEQ